MSATERYVEHLDARKESHPIDVAYVEYSSGDNWTVHYRIFVEWGCRIVVCEGHLCGFKTSDLAFDWVFATLPEVMIVTRRVYMNQEQSPRLQ